MDKLSESKMKSLLKGEEKLMKAYRWLCLILAMVLLVSFIVYYFINWNYLASVWPLG